jgi:Spy/CpxP family protein refolding chaperone
MNSCVKLPGARRRKSNKHDDMKITKHTLTILIALTGALVYQPWAQAADDKSPASSAANGAGGWRDRMIEAAKQLNLTDEQKEKLKPIFRSLMEKAQGLRDDATLSPQDRLQKLKALRDEAAPDFKKVLTPEQFEKWQNLQVQPPALRLQEAIKELNLTDEQKEKLKAVFQEPMEKFRALRADQTLTWQEKLDKFKAARDEIAPKVKGVLSAEQYEKYQKQVERVQDELRQRLQQKKQT